MSAFPLAIGGKADISDLLAEHREDLPIVLPQSAGAA
jgi:hypothetical protein